MGAVLVNKTNRLLRKKAVVFARLGGNLSVVRFPPSIMDQIFKKRVQKYMKFMLHEYWAKNTKIFNSISR